MVPSFNGFFNETYGVTFQFFKTYRIQILAKIVVSSAKRISIAFLSSLNFVSCVKNALRYIYVPLLF